MKITDFRILQPVLENIGREKLNGTECRLLNVWIAQGEKFNPSLSCFSKKMSCDTSLVSKTLRSLRTKGIIEKVGHDRNGRSIYQLGNRLLKTQKKPVKQEKPEQEGDSNYEAFNLHLADFIRQNPEHKKIDFVKDIARLLLKGSKLTDRQRITVESITQFDYEKAKAELDNQKQKMVRKREISDQYVEVKNELAKRRLECDAKTFSILYDQIFGFQSVGHLEEVFEIYKMEKLPLLRKQVDSRRLTADDLPRLVEQDLLNFCEVYKSRKSYKSKNAI